MKVPVIIKKVRYIISSFIQDWQKNPYCWNNEIDIQIELAGRIKVMLKALGKELLEAKYKGYERIEKFSRLCCESPIFYKYSGKRKCCLPDIVIFDDIPNPQKPPDEDYRKKNWPMLWVCEIKYETEWGGCFQKEYRQADMKKLETLLNQKDGTKFACFLDLKRNKNVKKYSVKIKQSKDKRLNSYKISPL